MVLKIKNTLIENTDLSDLAIESGMLLRLNFSNLNSYNDFLKSNTHLQFNQDVTNLFFWGKDISKKNIFSTYSPRELLKTHLNYNTQQIYEFKEFMYPNLKEKELRSLFNKKIKSLPFADRMVIYCKLFTEKNNSPFVIGTAGMHIYNLKLTYQLLNSFLSKGGSCIELTYPQIRDSQMDNIFRSKLKIVEIE